ncbi:uncharacterized protein LOC143035287 isoform X2 [Oratosquilla oratoria]
MASKFLRSFARLSTAFTARYVNANVPGIARNGTKMLNIPRLITPSIQRFSEARVDDTFFSDKEVKEKSEIILKAVQAKGINKFTHEHIYNLYYFLSELGVPDKKLIAQLIGTPDLLNFPLSNWEKICSVLVENGVSSQHILENIALYPKLLSFSVGKLRKNLLEYRQMMVGKRSLLDIINRYPIVYVMDPNSIRKRLHLLDSVYPMSSLKLLIKNNPNVLVDPWDEISHKTLYIYQEMGLEQPQISECQVLQHSLMHIQTRHQFLKRAGLYQKPNLAKDKNSYKINPSLADIVETSDKVFANKVAKMTDEEYSVFKLMIEKEERERRENEEYGHDEEWKDEKYDPSLLHSKDHH